jgi:hypothetical protein
MLWFVERKSSGRLGADPSAPLVVSRRSALEKKPWREAEGIENRVEAEFLRPALLGESIAPYRVIRALEAVIPVTDQGDLLDSEAAANRGVSDLHNWLSKADRVWAQYNKSDRTLVGQLNYINQLTSQFPVSPLRVVYAKAGAQPAACILRDPRGVVDHKLYWMTPSSEAEAQYLVAILNSETARSAAAQYQSRGQFGARDFDKVMFNLPIPRFDLSNKLHRSLAECAMEAQLVAASVELTEEVKFKRARSLIRSALTEANLASKIDGLVSDLIALK